MSPDEIERLRKLSAHIIEIAASDFQNILKDSLGIYNQIAEMLRDTGILRGRELARMTAKAQDGLKAALIQEKRKTAIWHIDQSIPEGWELVSPESEIKGFSVIREESGKK